MKINKTVRMILSIMLMFSLAAPLCAVQAAPAEGYNLTGWDHHLEKWSPGNLSGYTELDWVPFRLEVKNYVGDAVEFCFQHDYEKNGTYGYDDAQNFYIGDEGGTVLFNEGDGVFDITGPIFFSGAGGVMEMEYCFNISDPQALIDYGDTFYLYWETELAGPGQAGSWSGASLHTTTSVTGAQTVPINVQKITSLLTAQLELNKTVSSTMVNPGDTVTYTFEVTNTGDYDLSGVTVSDPLFGSTWSYPLGTLAAGETTSFEMPYTFPENTSPGTFINTATALATYSGGAVSDTDDETVLIQTVTAQEPSINIHKNVNVTSAAPGDEVSYSIHVTNTGNVDLTNVIVTDPMLGDTWSYTVGTLHAGEIVWIYATYTIPADAQAGALVNTATVSGLTPSGGQVTDSASTSLVIDNGGTTDPYAQVNLVKRVNTETANPGDTIIYTFTVTNMGTYGLTDTIVTDPLFGETWLYIVGALEPGASIAFDVSYVIPADALTGIIENTASVTAVYPDGTVNDTATETVSVISPTGDEAAISVDKIADLQSAAPGDTITYTITVTNTGNIDIDDAVVTDHLMGDFWSYSFGSLHAGQWKDYTYTYTVPMGTLSMELVNTAVVTGSYSDGSVTAEDSAAVVIDAPPPIIANLVLTSVCSENPDSTRRWKITNTNHTDVAFSWMLLESGESGSDIILGDADYFLETQTVSGTNTLKITYLDGREEQRVSSGLQCQDNAMQLITVHSMCVASPQSSRIEWQFTNPNDYAVTATWEIEDQTGTFVISPGISALYTDMVSSSPNTLHLYINDELYAVESRACFQDIILNAICSEDPGTSLNWTLTNNNLYPAQVVWLLHGTDPIQTGTVTVAGNSIVTISTNTIPGDNILSIFVDDVLQRDGTVLSAKVQCPAEETGGGTTGGGTIIELPEEIVPLAPGGEILIDDVLETPLAPAPEVPEELPKTGGPSALALGIVGGVLMILGLAMTLSEPKKSKRR